MDGSRATGSEWIGVAVGGENVLSDVFHCKGYHPPTGGILYDSYNLVESSSRSTGPSLYSLVTSSGSNRLASARQ